MLTGWKLKLGMLRGEWGVGEKFSCTLTPAITLTLTLSRRERGYEACLLR